MEEAGQKLRRARERLNLRYRDVVEASQRLGAKYNNDEFVIGLSRLSDIESGTTPTIYRLYSLCAIYRLSFTEVLEWYGLHLAALPLECRDLEIKGTHLVSADVPTEGTITLPLSLDPGLDVDRTTYLSRMIQRWGKFPLLLLESLDFRHHRYGYIGLEDWSMYPILPPGALVLVDESKRRVQSGGWQDEHDRPIYLVEHRGGFSVGWCVPQDSRLHVLFHPSAYLPPLLLGPNEFEVIGQVTGVAKRLDLGSRPRTRP